MRNRLGAIGLAIVAALGTGCTAGHPRGLREGRPDVGTIEWRGGRMPLRAAVERGGPLAPAQGSFRREFGGGILWAGERPEPVRAQTDRRLPPVEIDARLLEP